MTTLDELLVKLRDEGHLTQRDGLAALLETATQAADALEAAARENERWREAVAMCAALPLLSEMLTSEDAPIPATVGERIEEMGRMRKAHDAAILAARNALSGGPHE